MYAIFLCTEQEEATNESPPQHFGECSMFHCVVLHFVKFVQSKIPSFSVTVIPINSAREIHTEYDDLALLQPLFSVSN